MATWARSAVFAWQEPPYADARHPIESPQDAVDLVRVTVRACQRALHGPFSAAGDAVLLEVGVENELRRALAAAGELADPSGDLRCGWFEIRVDNYLAGQEWVDGHRVQRRRVPDHSELLESVMTSARSARAGLRRVVVAVQTALEPWAGMQQSCMTRENLAGINDALLAYDAAAAAHYRAFAAFRAVRTAEIEHAWRTVPTQPDLPLPVFGEAVE